MRLAGAGHIVLFYACLFAFIASGGGRLSAHQVNQKPEADPSPTRSFDPPVRVTVRTLKRETIRGFATGLSLERLWIEAGENEVREVTWRDLSPRDVIAIHTKLLDQKDARGWLAAGAGLYMREDAQQYAESAFRRALAIDPELTELVDRIKAGEQVDAARLLDAAAPEGSDAGTPWPPDDTEGIGGPVTQGVTQSRYWGDLSPELMEQSVEELRAFATKTRETMQIDIREYNDSEIFLFYTDLSADEARRWSGVLDAMYKRLCETFGVSSKVNVFRGKALVFVFQHPEDYRRFQNTMHRTDPGGSAGMAHGFGNGYVHIAFYRQKREEHFAGILVHEAVHGFLHRYRNHPHIPSWINEGLAEYVAGVMVPRHQDQDDVRRDVQALLKERGNTGQIMKDGRIEFWQYPIAQVLCEFMIRQDQKRYKAFVDAIKDGKPWREALAEDYGASPDRIIEGLRVDLRLRELVH